MKDAFIKLHLSVVIAGMTGVLGKLISLNEGLLVWWRMLLASVLFGALLSVKKRMVKIPPKEMLKIGGVGMILAFHWIFFYGSIKASNVSIGVVCFSLVGLFTALIEPLVYKRKISIRELLFSLLTLSGILLIFHFDSRYRLGIVLGTISSALAALFTVTNKRAGSDYPASTLLVYEMIGGFAGMSLLLPLYLYWFPVSSIVPSIVDFCYLLVLVLVCTIGLYLLQIQALRKISAFTVNLSYNLEPVYSIILAMILFGEAKELNPSFYIGLGVIVLSVILHSLSVMQEKRKGIFTK